MCVQSVPPPSRPAPSASVSSCTRSTRRTRSRAWRGPCGRPSTLLPPPRRRIGLWGGGNVFLMIRLTHAEHVKVPSFVEPFDGSRISKPSGPIVRSAPRVGSVARQYVPSHSSRSSMSALEGRRVLARLGLDFAGAGLQFCGHQGSPDHRQPQFKFQHIKGPTNIFTLFQTGFLPD